jgi:hypothetical protein
MMSQRYTSMSSDLAVSAVPPSATTPPLPDSFPDPFSWLSRRDSFCKAAGSLVEGFWAAYQPLGAAILSLGQGWDDHEDYVTRCLAVGEELRAAGLSAFLLERVDAAGSGSPRDPDQIAILAISTTALGR